MSCCKLSSQVGIYLHTRVPVQNDHHRVPGNKSTKISIFIHSWYRKAHQTLCVLHWMLGIFTKYEMINVLDSVSALIHLPNRKKNRIGQITEDLPFIRFTYHTTDNQQECSRLSNWFSFRCLGPWMNHFLTEWWSVLVLYISWWVSLVWWRRISLLISCLYSCFLTLLKLCLLFFLWNYFTLKYLFYAKYFVLSFAIDVVSTLSVLKHWALNPDVEIVCHFSKLSNHKLYAHRIRMSSNTNSATYYQIVSLHMQSHIYGGTVVREWSQTVCYNAVNFLKNIHKRHPIARPCNYLCNMLLYMTAI